MRFPIGAAAMAGVIFAVSGGANAQVDSPCAVANIGKPCSGGLTCVEATCFGIGTEPDGARPSTTCAVCTAVSAPYCLPEDDGKPCADGGGLCTFAGGSSGTTVGYAIGACIESSDAGAGTGSGGSSGGGGSSSGSGTTSGGSSDAASGSSGGFSGGAGGSSGTSGSSSSGIGSSGAGSSSGGAGASGSRASSGSTGSSGSSGTASSDDAGTIQGVAASSDASDGDASPNGDGPGSSSPSGCSLSAAPTRFAYGLTGFWLVLPAAGWRIARSSRA